MEPDRRVEHRRLVLHRLAHGSGLRAGCHAGSHLCTLTEAKAAFQDATLNDVQIGKGRDFAFAGAVDGLQLNNTFYDFEPFGVTTSSVS